MGNLQSTLAKKGYATTKKTKNGAVATKGDDTFFIKKVNLKKIPQNEVETFTSEIETLRTTTHPHIVSIKDSFKDARKNIYYVMMDYCQGGSLDKKIRDMDESLQESEVLSWFVEICLALKAIHEKGLLHRDLNTETVLLNEFGIVCLGGFGKIQEKSAPSAIPMERINCLAPEVFTDGTYDAKSDIWSLGCILFELCTQQPAFTAETTVKLKTMIIQGPYPSLPETFSVELCDLLMDILSKDPQLRPTISEILACRIISSCLLTKCKTTVADLQDKLKNLRTLADGLERVHKGTTAGSLAGGVIGAVGGITSIVGLILTPFTMGASLIVTGVGVGVGALGGVTAAASNITNMVNESSDRKAIRSIIKEFEQKINAVVLWLQEIGNGLETLRNSCDSVNTVVDDSTFTAENLRKAGFRAGKGLGDIGELVKLVQVANFGRIAAQTSRVVRVAEVATGVLSGLFVAVDIFFIAMDAKEIHHIRKAQAAEVQTDLVPESEICAPTSDQATPLSSSVMQESDNAGNEPEPDTAGGQDQCPIKSEIMKFVRSVRKAADRLEKVLDELKTITMSIPSLGEEREHEWQNME